MPSEPFFIDYAQAALDDLKSLAAIDRKKITDGIYVHLRHEPTKVSRSRIKEMAQPFWSQYRLRIDEFRVYYDVNVELLAINVLRVLKKTTEQTLEDSP